MRRSTLFTFFIAIFAFQNYAVAENIYPVIKDADDQIITLKAGDASLKKWILPDSTPFPPDNLPTPSRIELGKKLFFDTRLSGRGNMSCATCHNPQFGWSDGLPVGVGEKGEVLGRATPTIFNSGFNILQMWDGRKKSLEEQAMGPMETMEEMNMDTTKLFTWLNQSEGYSKLFAASYPGMPINAETLSKALASFERTIVSNHTRFDQWVAGKKNAMTSDEIKGFALFIDPKKANCAACHAGANFSDSSFHNIGLTSFGKENPDLGRYTQKPLALMKGAFRTPTIREISNTAPYFHDGSADTIDQVIDFYVKGGEVKTNLSPSIHQLDLTAQEKAQLRAFLITLSSDPQPFTLPVLPKK
jgi:cytochrome c peroxidase